MRTMAERFAELSEILKIDEHNESLVKLSKRMFMTGAWCMMQEVIAAGHLDTDEDYTRAMDKLSDEVIEFGRRIMKDQD